MSISNLNASISVTNAQELSSKTHGVTSKGYTQTRVSFNVLYGNEIVRLAIKELTNGNQLKDPHLIHLNIFERWFWKPISIETEAGKTTVLVNINSAIKRLSVLGFSKKDILGALEENSLGTLLLSYKVRKIEEAAQCRLKDSHKRDLRSAVAYISQNINTWMRERRSRRSTYPSGLQIRFGARGTSLKLNIKGRLIDFKNATLDSYIISTNLADMKILITAGEIHEIYKYVESYRYSFPVNSSYYLKRSGTGLARSVFINESGREFLLLNRQVVVNDGFLGKGSYKKVTRGIDLSSGEIVASASIRFRSDKEVADVQNEVDILHRIKGCSGVQKLIGSCSYYSGKRAYNKYRFITEYYCHGELASHLGLGISREFKKSIFEDIINAVADLHKNQIFHKDLKPSNIFVYKNKGAIRAVVGDFGLSCHESEVERRRTLAGTLKYMSPEYLEIMDRHNREMGVSSEYKQSYDMWALGLTLYQLVYNKAQLPWEHERLITYRDLAKSIKTKNQLLHSRSLLFATTAAQSQTPEDLIYWMLQDDPQRRITAAQARSLLPNLRW